MGARLRVNVKGVYSAVALVKVVPSREATNRSNLTLFHFDLFIGLLSPTELRWGRRICGVETRGAVPYIGWAENTVKGFSTLFANVGPGIIDPKLDLKPMFIRAGKLVDRHQAFTFPLLAMLTPTQLHF